MPQPLTRLRAIACPLLRDNIDTDALIPTSENTRVSTAGYADALFAFWRYLDIAARPPDPVFVLNKPPYDRAKILLSGKNFGCGSSRESAVWALRDFGFRVVIAESFNETFLRNCITNGMAPLSAARADLEHAARVAEARPDDELEVDLGAGRATLCEPQGWGFGFELDPYYRNPLVDCNV